ncbi:MAG: DUF4252 domain-containing protein [Acidobacteria bacterium]|nr:DUF4252 domain-containing protein [Acidobacteriota bacterium]
MAKRSFMEAVKSAKRMMALAAFLLAGFAAAQAQDARLQFSQLDRLASKADNVVEVSLDKNLLQVAAKFLSDKNPQEAAVKDLVSKLEGVYVRVFEFDKSGEYSLNDVEPIRSQVNAPGWSKIVGVMSKREGQKVDVHLRMTNGGLIHGLLILATQPRELVVVNIVGPIDLEKLSQLEGQFGIPKLDLDKSKAKPRQ